MLFKELTYTDRELEKDALRYLQSGVYAPSYINKVKSFIADDLAYFKGYYDDDEYTFVNVYHDEYSLKSDVDDVECGPKPDFDRLHKFLGKVFSKYELDDTAVKQYLQMLETEFKKNAYCTNMEPYFVGTEGVVATTVTGYARNPIFSIFSMVREWCMAMHLKRMYPQLMRKFGYKYQCLRMDYVGDDRLRKLIDFHDKYKTSIQKIGALRAVHSNVFAYAYLFLCAIKNQEVKMIEDFILDTSSSKVLLLFEGEAISHFDFPVTKYVLELLKEGHYKELLMPDGKINWIALYEFTLKAIEDTKIGALHFMGFDSIEAKTLQEFWNKSSNMQSMLKILRQLAMGNNDPVIARLIEMCEYRLGRPNKKSKRMERFLEYTRRILAERAREVTRTRCISQDLVAAFPSVFLVYFQWHHNFRNIYPKVDWGKLPEELHLQKVRSDERKRAKADFDMKDKSLKEVLLEQLHQKNILVERQMKAAANDMEIRVKNERMEAIMRNKERLLAEMAHKEIDEQRMQLNVKNMSKASNSI